MKALPAKKIKSAVGAIPGDVNRVLDAIKVSEAKCVALNTTDDGRRKLQQFDLDLRMDAGEHMRFHMLKSEAVASGVLNASEGQLIYAALGETPSRFNGQAICVRHILLQLFADLLQRQIARKS